MHLPEDILPPEWYERPTPEVARDLIGKRLARRHPSGAIELARITETEAYHGPEDRACHAHKGRTARTEIMFGPGGHWYVYLCYGVHWLLNIVTGPRGFPSAVLIRGTDATTGPGRVTRALDITRDQNKLPATPGSGLWISDAPTVPDSEVEAGPRIGIDYAGPEWSQKPWRYVWTPVWRAAQTSARKR